MSNIAYFAKCLEGDMRETMIRLVTAQQWAVACAIFDSFGNAVEVDDKGKRWLGSVPAGEHKNFGGDWVDLIAQEVSGQCAVDVVADLMGVD